MKMVAETIGTVSLGIDGSDQYLLVHTTEEATEKDVTEYYLPRVYKNTDIGGAYYCCDITVIKKKYLSDEFILIIHHRYNV